MHARRILSHLHTRVEFYQMFDRAQKRIRFCASRVVRRARDACVSVTRAHTHARTHARTHAGVNSWPGCVQASRLKAWFSFSCVRALIARARMSYVETRPSLSSLLGLLAQFTWTRVGRGFVLLLNHIEFTRAFCYFSMYYSQSFYTRFLLWRIASIFAKKFKNFKSMKLKSLVISIWCRNTYFAWKMVMQFDLIWKNRG